MRGARWFLRVHRAVRAADLQGLGVTPEADEGASTYILNGLPKIGPPLNGFIWSHPFGIDPLTGNDLFARWLYGARLSLGVSLTATVLTMVIGIGIGLIGGYSRGWLDRVTSFFIDFFLAFPFLLGALAIAPMINHKFADQPVRCYGRRLARWSRFSPSSAGWGWPG